MSDESWLRKHVAVPRLSGEWEEVMVVCVDGVWAEEERQSFLDSKEGRHLSGPIICKRLSSLGGREYLAPDPPQIVGPERLLQVLDLIRSFIGAQARSGVSFEEYFTDKELSEPELHFVRSRFGLPE